MVRVDLHLHTSASHDCRSDPEEVYRQCRRLGLWPVFVTDHDTIEGALAISRAHRGEVVIGEEVTTTAGEVIGLFLNEVVPAGLEPKATVDRIHAQGGLVYVQHPFDRLRRHLSIEAIEQLAELIDIVEVYNPRADTQANAAADDLRATLGVPAGTGSDAHHVSEIGAAYVQLEPFTDSHSFLSSLTRGVVVRNPNRFWLRAEASIGRYMRHWAERST